MPSKTICFNCSGHVVVSCFIIQNLTTSMVNISHSQIKDVLVAQMSAAKTCMLHVKKKCFSQ